MDGFVEHQLICRACLRVVENKHQTFGYIEDATGSLKDMIMCCVPEMDIYVSSNPIMCFPCIQLLITVYNFKTRCLNTETIIRSYIQRNNLLEYNQVNLSCVAQDLLKVTNYFREAKKETEPMDEGEADDQTAQGQVEEGCEHRKELPVAESQALATDTTGGAQEDDQLLAVNGQVVQGAIASGQFRIVGGQIGVTTAPAGAACRQIAIGNTQLGLTNGQILITNGQMGVPTGQLLLTSGRVEAVQGQTVEASDEQRNVSEGNSVNGSVAPVQVNDVANEPSVGKDVTQPSEDNNTYVVVNKPAVENRLRLIIKIDKNKISLPAANKDDSNEKENEVDMRENQSPPAAGPLSQGLYQCGNCTFVTTHQVYYVAHKKFCGEQDKNDKKCPHCPYTTNRQYALNKHINTMHTKAVWYPCDVCTYRSTDSSCLRRHKRNVHPDVIGNELSCHLCTYRCTTDYHLRKHLLKHNDDTGLQCQFCSYSTKDRSNFRKHVFIHNPKPQDCEFCDYKCVSPYQMKLHLKKFHNGVGMEDVDCRSEVSISEVVQDISTAIKASTGLVGHQTE